jgi:delta 1-pyrroline-5-carboxylate dehydrogenase
MKFALRVSREAQEDQGVIFLVCVCVWDFPLSMFAGFRVFFCPCLLGLGF